MYHLKAFAIGFLLLGLVGLLGAGFAWSLAFHPNFVVALVAIVLSYWSGLFFMECTKKAD